METTKQVYTAIDYAKFILAILVVGIHTEPFGFNFWLDKGFGIITRLCVPFFFVCSSFFFFIKGKDKNAAAYLKRITLLFLIWSLVYLPFDLDLLSGKDVWEVISYYWWLGPRHALWYLSGSIIGFVFLISSLKVIKSKYVLALSFLILIIGCIITTYTPLIERLLLTTVNNTSDCRNGLFYAFPYMALGMMIATSSRFSEFAQCKTMKLCKLGAGGGIL